MYCAGVTISVVAVEPSESPREVVDGPEPLGEEGARDERRVRSVQSVADAPVSG